MLKTFWKNSFKSIKDNISRFLAMISIVMLSSGVITGLLVTTPNMQMSMTDVFNEYNTFDFNFISSIGFDDENISYLNLKYGSEAFFEGYNLFDKVATYESKVLSSLLYELDLDNSKINKLKIVDGRFPLADNEILVEQKSNYIEEFKLNDTVLIDNTAYNIVGIVSNTSYFTKEQIHSFTSNKAIKAVFYKNFNLENNFYTNIFGHLNKSKSLNQFRNKYQDLIDDYLVKLEEDLIKIRTDRLIKVNEYLEQKLRENDVKNYVLTRSSNLSYQTYKTFVLKVDTITKIFPAFFLVVSILVVLATMTRMIEEERTQVGILRAIGYHQGAIYRKYLMYASLVGILGALLGYTFGFRLIPSIVNSAFSSIFFVPNLNLNVYSLSNIIYLLVIILSILVTTVFAINKNLKLNSAALLLPKAPKYGKRIILEKIPFFWNRLKFKYKSSLRNLFRYPNHFIMTVLGIAGSLALVFTGLALIDSIKAVTKIQYEEINNYDYTVDITNLTSEFEVFLNDNYSNNIAIYETTHVLKSVRTNDDFYVSLIVTDKQINEFITLRNRKTNEILEIRNDGIVITEQISYYLKLKVNDYLELSKTTGIKITGITESYINNYIFMTKEYYEEYFNETYKPNKVLVIDKDFIEEDVKDSFFTNSNVINVNFNSEEIASKDRLLGQVILLAIVIVLAAVFLAIIIIYNLTNVNISEREKELSTLKVLGYKNTEVSSYIFREINIMTLVGIIFGIPLGLLLQRYVIINVDEPNMMMGRRISIYTYLISITLTILVTILVELIMIVKIKKIDMVSALKEL